MLFPRQALAAALGLLIFALPALAQISFEGVGRLPGGGDPFSTCWGISSDGAVAVGETTSAASGFNSDSFRFTHTGGISSAGRLPGTNYWSVARAASSDGSVVAGYSFYSSIAFFHAYRFVPGPGGGTTTDLGDPLDNMGFSRAYGISNDGRVLVGEYRTFNPVLGHGFRWVLTGAGPSGVMTDIGSIAGGGVDTTARACSADGSVVVGQGTGFGGVREAFRWIVDPMNPTGPDGTLSSIAGSLPGVRFEDAYACSANGSVVVGIASVPSGREAVLWNNGAIIRLGQLSGAFVASEAYAVSANGRVVVGAAQIGVDTFSLPVFDAFIWNPRDGIRGLRTYLVSLGLGSTLGTWQLAAANGISADGRAIAGDGTDPAGNEEGFLARIPAFCYADFNGDSVVNVTDIFAYLAAWFANNPHSDFNLDGAVNVSDIFAFIAAWFAGCP
jgi:uncharacterized membrane protein